MKLETLIQGRPGSIQIDGSKFRYQREDGQFVEGEFSIQPSGDSACGILGACILIEGRVYRVTPGVTGERMVNGVPVAIEVFDPRALRTRQGEALARGRASIAAPMPGKIVRVLAAVGDSVEAGQGLVVVEAMKMQNEMKSPKTGRVAEVLTKPGAAVTAGEVLMVVE